jgi:hypothetical protein
LEFLGLRLDCKTNARPSLDQEISTADSTVRVLVIRAEEDWAIAKECSKLAQAHHGDNNREFTPIVRREIEDFGCWIVPIQITQIKRTSNEHKSC